MKTILSITLLLSVATVSAQSSFEYKESKGFPYGKPNPNAPKQIKDYQPFIGTCDCLSYRRGPDGNWLEGVSMTWTFKYIMNGMAVQDNTLKADGIHSGSIRQYNVDSSQWNVSYYSSVATASTALPLWTGNRENDKIVLYKEQASPQGVAGFSRLTFSNWSEEGYQWVGEWVDTNETIVFPFWKIDCKR